jgi:outer membrane lipoprotein-sorting protein
MKKFLLMLLLCLGVSVHVDAQSAKSVLDKTAATFTEKGAVKAEFVIKHFLGQTQNGQPMTGSILLNGKKFKLNAEGITTWFDGKTQWTFVPENEEVNVTEPTDEELQSINPYTFLNFYKKGYKYKFGNTKSFQGKNIYEVVLIAKSQKQDIKQVVLFVEKSTHQLMQIKFRQGTNNWMSITVTSFKGGQKVSDSTFSFDKKDAPNAEIIDLR